MPTPTIQEQFLDQLSSDIKTYRGYERSDQYIVFGLVWGSLLTSSGAALLTAIGAQPKELIAGITAVPALCLVIESQFNFSQQYRARKNAALELATLDGRVRFQGLSVDEADKKRAEIIARFAKESPLPLLSVKKDRKG